MQDNKYIPLGIEDLQLYMHLKYLTRTCTSYIRKKSAFQTNAECQLLSEIRLAVSLLVRESSTQLVMYSLDTCVRYSTYSTDFQVSERLHGGPEFPHNYLIMLIDYLRDYTIGFIVHYTIITP